VLFGKEPGRPEPESCDSLAPFVLTSDAGGPRCFNYNHAGLRLWVLNKLLSETSESEIKSLIAQ